MRKIFEFFKKNFFFNESLVRKRFSNVYYWNPKRLIFNKQISTNNLFLLKVFGRRINNFGDLLGPIIVKKFLLEKNIKGKFLYPKNKLLTIGSIFHFASKLITFRLKNRIGLYINFYSLNKLAVILIN